MEKELRIGNLIRRKSTGAICTVTWGVIKDIGNGEGRDYKPIPLDEDWLLSFGFKLDRKSVVYRYPKTDYFIGMWSSGAKTFEIEGGEHSGDYELRTLKYVHQLQNLFFALTDEELIRKQNV